MKRKRIPESTEITFSVAMIEEVFTDFERDNPGKSHLDQSKDDFTKRLMAKIMASARTIEGGNA